MSAVLYDAKTTLWVEIFGAVTFTANLYAIGIIAYKAWYVSFFDTALSLILAFSGSMNEP